MANHEALGLIETRGYIGSIEAADAAAKAADVELLRPQKADAGLVTILIRGDVASVRAAVDAGSAAARRVGELVSSHVIARADSQMQKIINPRPLQPAAPPASDQTDTSVPMKINGKPPKK